MNDIVSKMYSGNAIVLNLDVRSSANIYSLGTEQYISFFENLHALYKRIIENNKSGMLIDVTVQGDGLLAVFKGKDGYLDAIGMINDFFLSFKMIMLAKFNVTMAPVACLGMGQVYCFTTSASIKNNEPLYIGSIVHDVVHMTSDLESWHYAVQNSLESEFVISAYRFG